MRIWFRLHGFEFCSWTIVWENLSEAFKALGHEIEIVDNPKDPEDLIELWWGDPQYWSWSKLPVKARLGIALSEAHSILTPGRLNALQNLGMCETIICPSQSATIAFLEYPLDMPIKIAMFGINPNEFQYIERDWNKSFGFFHGGVTQFRKGSWLVPEAFVSTFNKKDRVYLTIASPKASPMYTELKMEYGDHPNIEFIHDIEESSNKYYENHHIYVSPHLSEGFGLCLHGNSIIQTKRGFIPIKDINIADEVLDINGEFQKLLTKFERVTDEYLKISFKGIEDLMITREHPIAILDKDNIVWKDGNELRIGNEVLIPIQKETEMPKKIDILDYIDRDKYKYDENYIFSKFGYSPKRVNSIKTISKETGYPTHIVEEAFRKVDFDYDSLLPHQRYIISYAKMVGYKKAEPIKIKRFVDVDEAFLSLIGWYLAEGSASVKRSSTEFSLSSDEMEIAESLSKIIRELFGIESVIYKPKNKKVLRLTICNKIFANFMLSICGKGALNKRIHPDLFLCPSQLLPLAISCIKGDGWISENRINFTTISVQLAYQIKMILLCNGIFPALRKNKQPLNAPSNYDIYMVSFGSQGKELFNKTFGNFTGVRVTKYHKTVQINGAKYYSVKINDIESINERCSVYNLEVDKTNTYTANNILVHNCIPEALATGMCGLVSRCSAPREFMSLDYGYWIEMSEEYAPVDKCLPNTNGFWRIPDVKSLAEQMRYCYENRDEAKAKGVVASREIRENLTWEHTAKDIVKIIEEVLCEKYQ